MTPKKNIRLKTRDKKTNNNFNLDSYYSSKNKLKNLDSSSKNEFKKSSNSPNNDIYKRNNYLNESDSDLISTSEFISVLENKKKNQTEKITLNDLFNFQFGQEENKMDTTSATTSLLKLDNNAILSISEMYLIYNSENNNIKNENYERNFCELNDLCDELTEQEKNNKNSNFIRKIPHLNYIEKIHKNKKEFEKIVDMKKYELINNSKICKKEYEKCLAEIKKYSGIINLEKLRKSYKNIKNLTDEELNDVFEDMIMKIKQKLPNNKAEKIAEDLYNLIYYENKYDLIERTIKKNS